MLSSFTESLFWCAVAACAIAQVAIVRSVVDSRRRNNDQQDEPRAFAMGLRTMSRTAGEVVWALIPAVALAFVLLWTWHTMHSVVDPVSPIHPSSAGASSARS
jgi:heme/copper-type cytochrome/quinol oxidase subunit 2